MATTYYEKQDYLDPQIHPDNQYQRSSSPLPPATPQRGSNESSPAASDYGLEIKNMITTSHTAKTLDVYHTKSHINLRINDTSSTTLYYIDNSSFKPGKADVTLIAGSEKDGRVVGVVRWSTMFSKHFNFGLGDPNGNERDVVWEELKTKNIMHPEYRWSMRLEDGSRKMFAWHRVHGDEAVGLDKDANKLSSTNYKLVDADGRSDGEVLAVYGSNKWKSWNKLGKFTFGCDGVERGWGRQWEVMVLLTALGLVEMSRRRGRARRSQGGSYGG